MQITVVIYKLNGTIQALKIIDEVSNIKDHAMWIVFFEVIFVAVKKSIIIL